MKQAYIHHKFNKRSLALIAVIDEIITDYMAQGYVLTVRQAYYQLVARGVIPNTLDSYKNTASLINDARLAGLLDWDGIEDRTRAFRSRPHWNTGTEILDGCAAQYHQDLWAGQYARPYVIIEKEALAGVLGGLCHELDVPLLAARGYPSASVLREFAQQHLLDAEQRIVLIHLGDHDPSGIDMTRDLKRRLELFRSDIVEIERIALNMDQIEEQKPPENPAKTTDSRYADYQREFGDSSWELDALTPQYLNALVRQHIEKHIDPELWAETKQVIKGVRAGLAKVAAEFEV